MSTLLRKTIQKIKPIQEATSNKPKSGAVNNLKLAAEFIAKVGIGAGVSALATKARTEEDRQKDAENISTNEIKKLKKNVSKQITSLNNIENTKTAIDQNYFNYLNNWEIRFGDNKVISDQSIVSLLENYTIEVSLPTINITTSTNDLVYIKNEDVSDISYNDISITFWLDEDMKIYKTLLNIINEMKDRLTGRMGYKDDYKWENISISINDNVGSTPLTLVFENCIIKSISDISLNQEKTDLRTISITLGYDRAVLEE